MRRLHMGAEAISALFQIELAASSASFDIDQMEGLCGQCHGLGKLYAHKPPLVCFTCHGTGLPDAAATPAVVRARALTQAIRFAW